jgi:hypothetical protein
VIRSTKEGARVRRRTRAAISTVAAIAATTAFAVPAQADLTAVGPTNAVTGVPDWYADAAGNKLTLCVDDINCGPNSSLSEFLASDGSGEAFYWRGVSNDVSIGGGAVSTAFALEAAFPNGAGSPPQTFIRMRIKARGVAAGTYRIDSPYGSFNIDSDGVKVNVGPADVICLQTAINGPCDFASILGVNPTGTKLMNFLHGTGMPAGYFGNGAGTSVVTGGNDVGTTDPATGLTTFTPVNTLTVTAPDGTSNSTDQWMITGKQFDPNAAPLALPPKPPVQGPKPAAPAGTGTVAGTAVGQTIIRVIQAPAQQVKGTAASSLAVSRLSLARRISISRLRAQGLRASMNVQEGTNVVRIGIFKTRNGVKTGRALFTAIRTPRSAGLFRVTLRSAKLSKLKPGLYAMEVRAGRSAASLGAARTTTFRVTR